MKLVACASASFYKHCVDIMHELEDSTIELILPISAQQMLADDNYRVEDYKTWFQNNNDYTKRANYVRHHFDEISAGDAILVVNDRKHESDNYIGPNVLLEMGLAWYLKKPIYILNEIPELSLFEEEIKGMAPIALHGKIATLKETL